jgi:epsilon-lactone hydrolase
LKRQLAIAFKMRDVNEARRYLDSIVITPEAPSVAIRPVAHPQFRGSWFVPEGADAQTIILYLHGGGYSFYPRGYADFIKQVALAANSRTFALNYGLSPEHRFPSQLEDALNGYRWLLGNGASPDTLVVAGDSAGANLALALLLTARDNKIPLPALAVAMSPPTGFENVRQSRGNQHRDWIDERMLKQWVSWFCDSTQLRNPLVSPVYADLRGLPPIYIQAGRAEILYESVQAFVDQARKQVADVAFESWENMTHVFQIFAPYVPQSVEALRRIGEVIHARTRGTRTTAAGS